MLWRWGGFLALSEIAVLTLLKASVEASAWPSAFFAVLLLMLAVPVFLTGNWGASLRRAHDLKLFRDDGRLRAILGGPVVRSGAWLVVSLALAVAVFVGSAGLHRPMAVALLVPPVLGVVFFVANRLLLGEVADPHRRAIALRAAGFLTPILLVVVDFTVLAVRGDMPPYATLAEAVHASIPSQPARSVVVDELVRLAGYVNAIEAFALGRVADWGGALRLAALLGLAALNLAFYSGLARVVAVFLVPRAELRRSFLPASDALVLRRLSALETGLVSALTTILLVFILIPALAAAEAWLKNNRPSTDVEVLVERIDGPYYQQGTIDILEKQRNDTIKGLGIEQAALTQAANAGFDAMARNVDLYLDAYYSLPAEYLRIASLVLDKEGLEQRLAGDLQDRLMTGTPFGAYEAQLASALHSAGRVKDIYNAGVERVLDTAKLDLPPDARIKVVATAMRSDLALPIPEVVLTGTAGRTTLGTAAGGLVAALVVKKAVAKGTLKLAAKAVAKVALSKAAGTTGGAGTGAAAGAFVGSVVPGIGTGIGAVVGGIIGGLSVGVGVDYLLLQLEEAWSREEFRQQILAAIEEQRASFLAQIAL